MPKSQKVFDGIISAAMSQEPISQKSKVCPTCGTRVSENATRCLVCGTELTTKAATKSKKTDSGVQPSRMPEVTLTLPAALAALVIVLLIGAAGVYFGLNAGGQIVEPTAVSTQTSTPTITPTGTEAPTSTLIPTETPLPPIDYTVREGETCGVLAATFKVSVQSIIVANNLSAECFVSAGQVLKIPYPTATPAPPPTAIPNEATQTAQACEKVVYTVQANDTLSGIAANYNVPQDAIRFYNGMASDNVLTGTTIVIPLCERFATPGPTPTPTLPPPYPAPSLLLPADGAAFSLANDVVTLQWASIGTLRDNEVYQVTVQDLTALNLGDTVRIVDYVRDTKYIVPSSFRSNDNQAHVIAWSITVVRQSGVDEQGQPVYVSAGAVSDKRVFSWVGVAISTTSP
jgi:LysM repeat protein